MRRVCTLWVFIILAGSAFAQGDFQKGLSYYKQGQYAKAIPEFEQIVKANPEYEDGYRILGDSYLQLRQYDKAIEAFQNALRLKSDKFVSYYGLAISLFNKRRYTDTAATLLRAERHATSPADRAKLYRLRGSAFFNDRQFARAVPDLQQAISLTRAGADELLQLAVSHYHLRNYAEAEKQFQQVLSIKPGDEDAKRYLARMGFIKATEAIEQGRYPEAISVLRNYLSLNPEEGEAWFNLGLAYLFNGSLGEAEKAFLQTTRLTPRFWEAHDRLGFIYEKNGNYPKALESYSKALELNKTETIQASVDRINERIRRQKAGS